MSPDQARVVTISGAEARRIALRAQRFGLQRPAKAGLRDVKAIVSALGAVQIDAVNVLARAHYLTIYSRLGPYRAGLLDDLVHKRQAFEYWGHAASLLPVELHPRLRWRMATYAGNKHWLAFRERLERERPGYFEAVEREVAERGPIAFTDLADQARRDKDSRYAASTLLWERGSDGKSVLEGLYDAGVLAAAGRRGFERLYDLTERVIPEQIADLPTPEPEDAQRALVLHAMSALGVATQKDVADYFRMPAAATRRRLQELVADGTVLPAGVEGWTAPAYLNPDASSRPVEARALLSPFDSLLWERDRTERLFGFRHSFELYVKAPKRRYGYYVLPFLLGEALVGRVDLKADRRSGALLVLGAFAETGTGGPKIAAALAGELRDLAGWLELETVEVAANGDLSGPLERALR